MNYEGSWRRITLLHRYFCSEIGTS